MDEPTAALGPGETAQVKELIHRLKQRGVGIILISHDIEDVFELADRLVVMAGGRIVGELLTHEATRDQVLSLIIMGAEGAGAAGAPVRSPKPVGRVGHGARLADSRLRTRRSEGKHSCQPALPIASKKE